MRMTLKSYSLGYRGNERSILLQLRGVLADGEISITYGVLQRGCLSLLASVTTVGPPDKIATSSVDDLIYFVDVRTYVQGTNSLQGCIALFPPKPRWHPALSAGHCLPLR